MVFRWEVLPGGRTLADLLSVSLWLFQPNYQPVKNLSRMDIEITLFNLLLIVHLKGEKHEYEYKS